MTIRPLRGTSGACYLLVGQRDIADRVQLAAQREREARRLDKLMAFAPDVIWMIDADATITFVTQAISNILGFDPDELCGVDAMSLLHPSADQAEAVAVFAAVLADPGTPHQVDLWVRHRDGSRVRAECIVTNRLHDPDLRAIVVNARDITERHESQARLAHRAVHDDLTGLPNRRHLEASLDELLVTRSDPATVATLFIDIDGFKEVNDNLGHHAGDLVLCEAAERLVAAVGPHGFVSRFGGDEYVVVSTAAGDVSDHLTLALRIQEAMTRPFEIVGATFFLSASIGIAFGSTREGHDASAMLSDADLAMYRAKLRGRSNIVVFDDSMRSETVRRLATANELRRAIDARELELHYQPIIDLMSGELAGCEALVRWNHATRGLVPPGDFIPIAEQTGLIVPLGALVIDEACAQIARWNRAGHRTRVSVNVSPLQLVDPAFGDEVLACVSRHGSTRRRSPSRSPRRRSCTSARSPARSSRSSTSTASSARSTTSARATRRWRCSSACRSAASRSIGRSSTGSARTARARSSQRDRRHGARSGPRHRRRGGRARRPGAPAPGVGLPARSGLPLRPTRACRRLLRSPRAPGRTRPPLSLHPTDGGTGAVRSARAVRVTEALGTSHRR